MLRLSARVLPGNSGGPLLDGSGRIVGIVYAIEIATGLDSQSPSTRCDDWCRRRLREPAAMRERVIDVLCGRRGVRIATRPNLPRRVVTGWLDHPVRMQSVDAVPLSRRDTGSK